MELQYEKRFPSQPPLVASTLPRETSAVKQRIGKCGEGPNLGNLAIYARDRKPDEKGIGDEISTQGRYFLPPQTVIPTGAFATS